MDENIWGNEEKEWKKNLSTKVEIKRDFLKGTADEKTMLNYYSRVIEPILTAIIEELERKWISKTAQSQGQAVRFFRDPFKLVPISNIADIADKFTRNCIMTSNEMRSKIGLVPSKDPKADQLINSNLNQPEEESKETKVVNGEEKIDLSQFKIS